jgi:MFS family permease
VTEKPVRVHRWTDPVVVGVVLAALAAGFGQFGAVAALGDVAKSFGHVAAHGATIADQAGLSGTQLGIGLAIIRLASLGGMPLAGLADRFGRRRALIGGLGLGLTLTVAAAASPTYWAFVAIFACGRPLLSATNALTQVVVAEQTASAERAKAVAFAAGGYGVGAGLTAIVHSLAAGTLGFRGIFLLAAVPLALLPFLSRRLVEPDRFTIEAAGSDHPTPVIGAIGSRFRRRLLLSLAISFALNVISGPANSFVFLYAQNVEHLSGGVTAAMVAGAGATGLGGLLLGRWLADRLGRRPTAALGTVGVSIAATLTYSGPKPALLAGYVLGVLCGSIFAPAVGSFVNELFPTSVRASVAGWWIASGVAGASVGLVVFGAVADVGNRFALAAAVTFLPVALCVGLFWLLPETRGREPEDLWPAA